MKSFEKFTTDEEKESVNTEALDAAARRKLALRAKITGKKRAKARKRSEKKMASPEKLKDRATKKARDLLVQKILKGKKKGDVSFAKRADIEDKIKKKAGVVKKLAKRLLPKIKAAERERLKKVRGGDDDDEK